MAKIPCAVYQFAVDLTDFAELVTVAQEQINKVSANFVGVLHALKFD